MYGGATEAMVILQASLHNSNFLLWLLLSIMTVYLHNRKWPICVFHVNAPVPWNSNVSDMWMHWEKANEFWWTILFMSTYWKCNKRPHMKVVSGFWVAFKQKIGNLNVARLIMWSQETHRPKKGGLTLSHYSISKANMHCGKQLMKLMQLTKHIHKQMQTWSQIQMKTHSRKKNHPNSTGGPS